ncbi:MAG: replication restart DNA helicase PriA [Cyanobacteria bacterium P01_C01_bin.69]
MQIVKTTQTVHCPTCGSFAERRLLRDRQTTNGEYSIQTACPACDYFMVVSSLTGKVLEAYAPGQVSA